MIGGPVCRIGTIAVYLNDKEQEPVIIERAHRILLPRSPLPNPVVTFEDIENLIRNRNEAPAQCTPMPATQTMKQYDKDPWKHRSEGMRCRSCMWCVLKDPNPRPFQQISEYGGKRIGRCRRHALTMNGYPVVFEDDWCGDHKLDETKV